MILYRWKRNIFEGIKNLSRNKVFTFASIATMSLCIFLVGIFFAIAFNIMTILKNVESSVPLTVYFEAKLPVEEQRNIEKQIQQDNRVKETKFITPEEAWEKYKVIYFQDMPELADGFKNDNPLVDAASIEVNLKSIEYQNDFVKKVEEIKGVRRVIHFSDVVEKIESFNSAFTYVALFVVTVLLFIAIFLISNTVSIGISVRKEEIQIMRYVGAKNKFIRGPFVTEGIIIGIIGAIIPLVMEYFLYSQTLTYMAKHFELLNTTESFVPISVIFRYFLPMALVIALLIGYFASRFTISRYLRR